MWLGKTRLCALFLLLGGQSAIAQYDADPNPQLRPSIDPRQLSYPETPGPRAESRATQVPIELPPLPQSAPAGIDAGPFKIYPAFTVGTFFDDNVFATRKNRESDWVYFTRPELTLKSSGPQHSFEAQAAIEARKHSRFNSDDQINGAAALGGVFQPDRDTQLLGRLRYTHAHEDRGSGESVQQQFDKPIAYNQFEAGAGINKRFGQWWTSIGAARSWIEYETSTIGGVSVDQSYRDGHISFVQGRIGHVVAPHTSVFVELAGNRRDFEINAFDSKGYRLVGGVLLEPGQGSRLRGEAFAGYMFQDYTGTAFETISTWTYGGTLALQITPQLTTTITGRREAKESALNGGGSLIDSLAGVRFDYQVNPKLSFGVGTSYLANEFKAGDRTDRTWSPLASVKYIVNPHVTLGFDYRYLNFDSTGLGATGYYRNVYLFSFNGRI